jgi:hypothetical protein
LSPTVFEGIDPVVVSDFVILFVSCNEPSFDFSKIEQKQLN